MGLHGAQRQADVAGDFFMAEALDEGKAKHLALDGRQPRHAFSKAFAQLFLQQQGARPAGRIGDAFDVLVLQQRFVPATSAQLTKHVQRTAPGDGAQPSHHVRACRIEALGIAPRLHECRGNDVIRQFMATHDSQRKPVQSF